MLGSSLGKPDVVLGLTRAGFFNQTNSFTAHLQVDVWIREQRHNASSPYRYTELSNGGLGPEVDFTGEKQLYCVLAACSACYLPAFWPNACLAWVLGANGVARASTCVLVHKVACMLLSRTFLLLLYCVLAGCYSRLSRSVRRHVLSVLDLACPSSFQG